MKFFLKWIFTLAIWAMAIIGVMTGYFAYDLPNTDKALEVSRRPLIIFVARDGSRISESGNLKGDTVQINNLPRYITNATASPIPIGRGMYFLNPINKTRLNAIII